MKEKYIEFRLNKWRIGIAVMGMLSVIWVEVLFPQSMLKFDAFVCALFGMGALINLRIKGRFSWLILPLEAVAAAGITVLASQLASGFTFEVVPMSSVLLGAEIAFAAIVCAYFLFLFLLPGKVEDRLKPAIITASFLLLLLSVISFYTMAFRGRPLAPEDLLSAGTAINVMGEYSYSVPVRMQQALLLYAASVFLLSGIKSEPMPKLWVQRIIALIILILVSLHLHVAIGQVKISLWETQGPYRDGFLLNFAGQLQQGITLPPSDYAEENINKLEEQYGPEDESAEQADHVIVIMNEAFADMRVWGEFETDKPAMYFYDGLSENTIKGYALSSVLGGSTANSEYEFLTGNTMGFMTPSAIPFQQYVKGPIYTLERYLNTLNYSSYFTHPEVASNWHRDTVYPLLGFEDSKFLEAYEDSDKFRIFVSDEGLYDKLIEEYESRINTGNQFIFAVTMQNHSPYKLWAENVEEEEKVHTPSLDSAETEQYLSCIYASNRALEKLLNYFQQREERVVILMYGDHQPVLPDEFYDMVYGPQNGSLEELMLKHYIPFVIWANYDIEEKNVELTSLNFLSNYLLEAAGLPLSPYNQFLKDVQELIPAMNAYGYWSESKGGFAAYDEAMG